MARQNGRESTDYGCGVSQALKRYARRAGLDPEGVNLHSLRHLGAELFQEASRDVQQTQQFLDHAQLNTTQIYLTQLTGEDIVTGRR